MLAKAAANEGGAKTFFYLSSADLITKWVGSSEIRIKQLFKLAAEMAPSVVFLGKVVFFYSLLF
jgi:vacuolar protein-sorting-associated protein 4